jgi:uncharacterized protein
MNETLARLKKLHDQVDESADDLDLRLEDRLSCGPGCPDCCVDELTVFEIEALRIRTEYPQVLTQSPGPAGRCAFLDEKDRCRVYEARPYVCRTQGLPLRWMEETEYGWVEFRDICPINDSDEPIESLDPGHCFTLGPVEEKLRELQMELSGELTRVKLREMLQARTTRPK